MLLTETLLTDREAAEYLRIHVETLRLVMRRGGGGPAHFTVLGRRRYRREDLDEWARGNTPARSA